MATFSIVGYDPKTGDLGVAVQSSFSPWAAWCRGPRPASGGGHPIVRQRRLRAGRSRTLRQGPIGQQETVDALTKADANRRLRQLGIVDAKGRSASFTGSGCKHWAGHIEKPNFCAQGNILTGEEVVRSMVSGYEQARKKTGTGLCDWLALALMEGQKAGGDSRGRQSAALLVVLKTENACRGQRPPHRPRVDDHRDADPRNCCGCRPPTKMFRRAHENPPNAG